MTQLLLDKVETYWKSRSDSYSSGNMDELNSNNALAWKKLIKPYAPPGKGLKVLDVGTGPGFLALVLAQCGHKVTAIDFTGAMLEKASINAALCEQKITFSQMDAQDLDFDDHTFDLVISRNLTWNLEAPQKAYNEFFRVLDHGGRVLNFDANWYLHLFDDQARTAWDNDRQTVRTLGYPDHYESRDTLAMSAIAENLPLSRVSRPEWDVKALMAAGFTKVMTKPDIGKYVWDETQKVNFASTPMFMIAAEKQQ